MTNAMEYYEKFKQENKLKTNSYTTLVSLKNEYLKKYRTKRATVQSYKNYSSEIFKRNAVKPTFLSHGRLWSFNYYLIGISTLPNFDASPLILTLDVPNKESFMGINLHLLPPTLRIYAFYSLFPLLNNRNFKDKNTRFRLFYEQLRGQERYVRFLPCIREYKTIRIRSDIHQIDPKYWDAALFNPTSRFFRTNIVKVWAQTVQEIRKKISERNETL